MQYTLRGTVNTEDPRVQAHVPVLAQRLRDTAKFRLRNTAKMLYWLEHATVQLIYPIEIIEHRHGISSVHPGQTRFLAAALLNRAYPCVLRTPIKHSSTVLNAVQLSQYKIKHTQCVAAFDCVLRTYEHTAQQLEQQYGELAPVEFYTRILSLS